MKHDLTNQVIEAFSWLESNMGFERLVLPYENTSFIKNIIYQRKGTITITFTCDNREHDLDFEIFVKAAECRYSITEYLASHKRNHQKEGLHNAKYERVFEYTRNNFSEEQFQSLKNQILWRRRLNIKEYVGLYSELLKIAVTTIEARLG